MTEASWALVGVTIILVLLTGWYATETRRTVRRMDREREEGSRPILTLQLIPWQADLLKLRIQNVGNGPATEVKGTIKTLTDSGWANIPWSYPLLTAGKYEEFGFPILSDEETKQLFNLDAIRSKVIEARAEFTYNSVYGKQYELEDSIQVQQVTNDWVASKMMATQDHPDRLLPRIAETLEDISNKLRNR